MEKQIITFSASEQTLTKTGGIDHYASNTVSYVQAIFDLGENWAGFDSVRAVFKTPYKTKPAVLDHSGRCLVPFEVLKYKCKVFVNLVGSISEEGVLTDRLTSYPIEALTIDANASVDNSETAISPTEFEEFVAIVSDDADRAEAGATASEASAESAEASAESALASAQASEASAIRASNSASDASASAQTAQEEAQKITGMVVVVTQLPEGAEPTADWSDGVLTIGIPKGDTGATGATGNGIESAVLNADYTLTLTFTDGTSYTTPSIRGATGATGATGNGISSVTLTSTSGAVKTYTIAFTDGTNTTFDVTDGEVTQAVLDEEITALKADISDNGVVQGSHGLVSDSKIFDSVPYLFRQTADGQRVGNVVYEEIVGGTVAWNQLAKCTNPRVNDATLCTITSHTDTSMVADFNIGAAWGIAFYTETNIPFILGHKYFFGLDYTQSASTDKLAIVLGNVNGAGSPAITPNKTSTAKQALATIVNCDIALTSAKIFVQSLNNDAIVSFENVMAFDLTQMFGSTIADYIYSFEQANAGAGVAWFKKLFPKPYYAYNAGQLMSVKALRHITRGFNAWDEEWEYGKTISDVDGSVSSGSRIVSKNFIPCIPNTQYYFTGRDTDHDIRPFFYDADKNYISAGTWSGYNANKVQTTPNNCHFMKFHTAGAYGTTYNHDICINLHWDGERDGEYEEYSEHVYELDPDLELRGIPKLSAGNDLYYDGDVYEPDGTVTRKYGIVDMGTLAWRAVSGYAGFFVVTYDDVKPCVNQAVANVVCSKYRTVKGNDFDANDKVIGVLNSRSDVFVHDSAYETLESFKTAMSGVYLVYELATPTTETAEPYASPQIVDRYGTEEYVTTGIVPIGHNSKYSKDLKGKIESLPWDFSTLIAPTETAYKATRNYTSGSLLIVNNTLYKATANIQSGGTITPNTNVTATTLAEVIASL